MSESKKSVYAVLSAIDCRAESKKKNGLTYLPWAWAWAKAKENYPTATYRIYESAQGWNYHTDGRTAWVKCGVTIEDIENIEYLPVMDHKNQSIPVGNITSFAVNKSIQRCLTKALARHGLGLYIFAGEDMPEGTDDETSGNGDRSASNTTPSPRTTPPVRKAAMPVSAPVANDGGINAKKESAWLAFKSMESVKSMDAKSKGRFFLAQIKTTTGKEDPTKLTAADWDKVIESISAAKAE